MNIGRCILTILGIALTLKNGYAQSDALIPFLRKDLWGYANRKGEVVIPPIYKAVHFFYNYYVPHNSTDTIWLQTYYARVQKDETSWIIDDKGRLMVVNDNPYDVNIQKVNDSLLVISGQLFNYKLEPLSKKYKSIQLLNYYENFSKDRHALNYYSYRMNWIVEPKINYLYAEEDYHKFGIIDLNASEIIPCEQRKISNIWNYKVILEMAGKAYPIVYDINSKTSKQLEVSTLYQIGEGLIAATKSGKWGFIDINGNIVIPFQFQNAYSFKRGKALVRLNEKEYAIINNKGEIQLTIQNPNLLVPFEEGFFLQKQEGWIQLDSNCKQVHNLIFDEIPERIKNKRGNVFFCGKIEGKYGLTDDQGKILLPFQFAPEKYPSETLKRILLGEQGGDFINNIEAYQSQGFTIYYNGIKNRVVLGVYDFVQQLDNGGLRVLKNGKYGIIDAKDRIMIPPIYDNLYPNNGRFKINDKASYVATKSITSGVIDSIGNVIIPFIFYSSWLSYDYGDNENEVYIGKDSSNYYKVDREGNVTLLKNIYFDWLFNKSFGRFSTTTKYLKFQTNHGEGIMNLKTTKIIIPGVNQDVNILWDSLAIVEKRPFSTLIRLSTMDTILHLQYESIASNRYGVIYVRASDFKTQKVYDLQKRTYIECDFVVITPLKEGLRVVAKDEKYGYADENYQVVIPFQFEEAQEFHNGIAAVKYKGGWGYIDKEGQWVTKPTYGIAYDFEDGLGQVSKAAESGYTLITRQGEVLIANNWYKFNNFSQVNLKDGRTVLIDSTGKIILENFYKALIFEKGVGYLRDGKYYEMGAPEGYYPYLSLSNNYIKATIEDSLYHIGYCTCDSDLIYDDIQGIVNKNRKVIIPIQNHDIQFLEKERVFIVSRGKKALFDINGKPLTLFKYDIIEPSGIPDVFLVAYNQKRFYIRSDGFEFYKN